MVINENNSHINTFVKGMNSDQAFDQIQNSQYTFAKNVRITKNQLLGGASDYSSVREGIVAPVPEGVVAYENENFNDTILAVKSVDNLCIIVSTDNEKRDLSVYKAYVDEIQNTVSDFHLIWQSKGFWDQNEATPSQISAVLYKELENVVKLYIATGKTPVIVLRVDDEGETTLHKNNKYTNVDYLINNRIIPQKRVFVEEIISGRLKTSQVQYTYRYYNKYSNTTQLAPLTNKIQIIDPSRSKEIGNAENTETSVGLAISIDVSEYKDIYERLQVYRLSYITPNQDSEIALIYDGKISSDDKFILNDVGIEPLQILTIEEFSAMSGVMLIPKVIEQNQEYMFCANVSDDTIIKDLNVAVDETPFESTKSKIVLATDLTGAIPDEGKYTFADLDADMQSYIEERSVNSSLAAPSYNNIITSSLLRSLRRGETYRYGIVYYDKYGRRSDVKTIGDFDVPSISSNNMPFGVETINNKDILVAYPLGVKIKIPQIQINSGVDPNTIVGCQIVRRSSSDVYQNTLMQVALARPIQQGLSEIHNNLEPNKQSPFYPSGFLSVSNLQIFPSYYTTDGGYNRYSPTYSQLWAQTKNSRLFQIFSSEIDFRRDDALSKLNVSDTTIKEAFCIPSVCALYETGSIKENLFKGITQATVSEGDYTTSLYIEPYDDHSYRLDANNLDLKDAKEIRLYPTAKQNENDQWQFSFGNYSGGSQFFTASEGEDVLSTQPYNLLTIYPGGEVASEFASRLGIKTNNLTYCTRELGNTTYTENIKLQIKIIYDVEQQDSEYALDTSYINIDRKYVNKLTIGNKKDFYYIYNYFVLGNAFNSQFDANGVQVQSIKDVKIPNWNDGFDRVQFGDDGTTIDATKQYTGFNTTVNEYQYDNWASFGKYDMQAGTSWTPNQGWDEPCIKEILGVRGHYDYWLNAPVSDDRGSLRNGFIGPGPSCFLLTTTESAGSFPAIDSNFYTSVCNIQHSAKHDNVESDEHTSFYGFGNYFELAYNSTERKLKTINDEEYLTVFDGDIYITPHEFTTMYKAYNFESVDTLQSTQITNYIPLESKVNTYFDYGMNLRNTSSANLMYEPGSIDGVTTQERPAHQYNMIYSDNDASNDVFTLISTDKNETNQFKQRAYFSELKNNGEFIDNFLIFKALSFIDVDSKYGQITEMYTDKNILYYWQEHAFGKFSVNERSLINDQNGNTIMLGQAGILSRYDYMSTKYGMRLYDFCGRSADNGIYWVDMNNKAVVAAAGNQVVNYGEQLGVQNIINDKIDMSSIPNVDYDIQNSELLCKMLNDNEQLVFNVKYNMPTSIYTRGYDKMVYIKNHIYGLYKNENENLSFIKYNYLFNYEDVQYLSPMVLDFIINPNASVVKVFDNQQITPIKRSQYKPQVLSDTTISVETDMYEKQNVNIQDISTDREGNIIYAIPRFGNRNYGNRMRGKWMKVRIHNSNPTDYSTLSHVITKFRQSFS